MADYDEAEVTTREQLAADHQKELGNYAAQSTKNQYNQLIGNYDYSNRQNRALADTEKKQNARKTEADRFQAMRSLQNAAQGVLGTMGQAMNGSGTTNMIDMLDDRVDNDNVNYWTQHQVNQDAVENAYQESLNQNNVNKNDAAINAEYTLRGLEGDMAANLNNINPNLYQKPGEGDSNFGSNGFAEANKVPENYAELSGYIMPENSRNNARREAPANTARGNSSYFNQLINSYNQGKRYM